MSYVEADEPSPLVGLLQQFNRKERYWLLADALGVPFRALDPNYRQRLADVLGFDVPANAWWALDYHFDWLHAALCCAPEYKPELGLKRLNVRNVDNQQTIRGTHEDTDLIIAFDQTIILVEAKGVTGWKNGQMGSKAKRLMELSYNPAHIRIRLVLTSPEQSKGIGAGEWVGKVPPQMMRSDGAYYHLPMHGLGGGAELLRVERCSDDRAAHDGDYWRIITQKGAVELT